MNKPMDAPAAQSVTFELAAQLTIAHAADLHRELTLRMAGGNPLIIDGTRVEQIDTAALQLLVGCWRSCAQRNIPCSWRGASENLRRSAALIGVTAFLHLASA